MRSNAVPRSASAPLEDSTGASHIVEGGVRVEMVKIESAPISKSVQAAKLEAVPVVAVAAPFQSTVQLPFPENGASVTGISSPTLDRRVPHPGSARRT